METDYTWYVVIGIIVVYIFGLCHGIHIHKEWIKKNNG